MPELPIAQILAIADDMIPMLIGSGINRNQASAVAQPYQQFAQAKQEHDQPGADRAAQSFLQNSTDLQQIPIVAKARQHATLHLQRTSAGQSGAPAQPTPT